ncbi:Atrial natriuretic peptide receptor 1 [Hypsibius exemplaris]|uniref:Guanylate cyclase n=1 Tax=Hypsibius exemplaris TaxID=2072580 RepID=A0A1W0WAR4_HYPEX|nr:Atrial natriuretic peptide receptor 1 [Hypsibius exemplaris]
MLSMYLPSLKAYKSVHVFSSRLFFSDNVGRIDSGSSHNFLIVPASDTECRGGGRGTAFQPLRNTSDFIETLPTIAEISADTRGQVDTLTICVIVESDSYFTTMQRTLAVVDLSVSNVNAYVLPKSLRVRAKFQSAGPSCSKTQYSVISSVYKLLHSGTTCHAFLGAGCASTASSLYGIADSLNTIFIGTPSAGMNMLALDASQDYFPLLIAMAFEFGDLADAIVLIFNRYNYTHFAILRDDSQTYFNLLSKAIMFNILQDDLSLVQKYAELPFTSATFTTKDYERMLRDAAGRARVIGLCMAADIIRKVMILASGLGFANGEYVYIAVELYDLPYWGKIHYSTGEPSDNVAREAYQSILIFSLHIDTDSTYDDDFEDKVKSLSLKRYNYSFNALEQLDPVITSTYEAIQIYGQELKTMQAKGLDYRNGTLMSKRIRGGRHDTDLGRVIIGEDGQRDMDYDILAFNADKGKFEVMMTYFQHPAVVNDTFRIIQELKWPNALGTMPPDEPMCGFRNDQCRNDALSTGTLAAAIIVPIIVVLGIAAAAIYTFLKLRTLHTQYNPNWWKINSEEVIIKQNRSGSTTTSRKTIQSKSTIGTSNLTGYSAYMCDLLGSYKNTLVMLTDVTPLAKHVTPELVAQVTLLKGVASPNLQGFIGISMTQQNICELIVCEVCAKGSLTDVLDNEMFKLDWSFKNSLIRDVVFGMTVLHTSPIVSHGNLTSHSCLIDSRFSLKISDYGLSFFRDPADLLPPKNLDTPPAENESSPNYERLLWRAPELLRQIMPAKGTQRGDVYSFAIVLQQIILRSGPFELPSEPLEISNREIIKEVINSNVPPVRPRVPRASCSNELYDLMERCWEEIPLERPTFPNIKNRLKKAIGEVGDNIVDVLFKRMEQYATDLEFKVAEKTRQFMDEKTRSEQLLGQLLPQSVAAALMRGEHVDPEAYESVTIYFSDIVGFTTISAAGSPMDVVGLLNSLYTFFDNILEKYDVYKVETIGDAYMVSSGLPVRNGNRHAAEISRMSLTLVKGIVDVIVPNRADIHLQVRIGINSGPCVAGIVGLKMPRYCLFGDTVNVASRMESTGEPMKIQISESTKHLLDNIGGFHITERGPVAVKGKGVLTTHWLLS